MHTMYFLYFDFLYSPHMPCQHSVNSYLQLLTVKSYCHHPIFNAFLTANISNSNNVKKFCIGIFNSQSHIIQVFTTSVSFKRSEGGQEMIRLRSDNHVTYNDDNNVNDFCALFTFLHPYLSRISRGISDIADTLGIKGIFENLFSNMRPVRCLCKILRTNISSYALNISKVFNAACKVASK